MLKIRYATIIFSILFSSMAVAGIQMSIGVGLPSVSIGVNVSRYPEMVVVPGYPVYYAPRLNYNLFFYDGYYWLYQDDYWYISAWYNGPWSMVEPEFVPIFILQVPVRYYRAPPLYFRGWQFNAAPRWGDHWGREWDQRRRGWDREQHNVAPAPLPSYQRQYSGERYPRQEEQQRELYQQHYNYQPHDPELKLTRPDQPLPAGSYQQEKRLDQKRQPEGAMIQKREMPRSEPFRRERIEPQNPPLQHNDTNIQRSVPITPQQERSESRDFKQQRNPSEIQHEPQKTIPRNQKENERSRDMQSEPIQRPVRNRDRNE
ncbi:hypothetical protein GALL_269430 [mine drainage metagenome]|uniref:Uncharacterized protein n=1 Tax=mine drainage metagenome TaxID=410659 RepID=A0A1J5R6W7_9ZZZZ